MNALAIAAALSTFGAAPLPVPPVEGAALRSVVTMEAAGVRAAVRAPASIQRADAWLSEDKFRHAAASWTVAVFSYAAARAVGDGDTALRVALPVTAAAGLTKEVFDVRAGGPFSLRDLVADAAGAAAAWLVLREVR